MSDDKDIAAKEQGEYRVFARKYRPLTFADVIGQEPMVQTLTNAFAMGRIAQAYMLTGVRGVGKTTTARILARALNYKTDDCDVPNIELATIGEHCQSIMDGNHVDVIEMDAASHTGIDDIRELIASTRYKPVSARYKVFIIDEVHMLSKNAFNGLLKTLEEPPEHVKFIFATTEIRKVPITVLSRCQRFDLRRIEASDLSDHLKKIAAAENVEVEDDAIAMIARAAEGSARDALSLLDQAIAHSSQKVLATQVRDMLGLADRARVIDLFEHIMGGDIKAALAELKSQYDTGADPAVVLTDLADFVHYVTRVRFVPEAADDPSLSQAERERGKEFADKLSVRVLGRAWQMLLKGIAEVEASPRAMAAADMVLVRLTHAADLPTPDEAIKKLMDGDGIAPSAPNGSGSGNAGSSAPNGAQSTSHSEISGGSSENSQTPSKMSRTANGPTLVSSAPTQQSQAPEVHSFSQISTFEDLLQECETRREIALKLALRNNVRIVRFEAGRIELNIVGNPSPRLLNDLSGKLLDWTGQRWIVATSRDEGSATIAETETAMRDELVRDATLDPTVAAILQKFQGAKIVDVRVRENEDVLEAVQEPDENDDGSENKSKDGVDDGLDDYFKQ